LLSSSISKTEKDEKGDNEFITIMDARRISDKDFNLMIEKRLLSIAPPGGSLGFYSSPLSIGGCIPCLSVLIVHRDITQLGAGVMSGVNIYSVFFRSSRRAG
jgi:hypothetical protein